MTVAVLSMLSIKDIQNSQMALKGLVVCMGTSEIMRMIFITCSAAILSR